MKRLSLLLLALTLANSAYSQGVKTAINSLFASWNADQQPGGVVLVSHNNKVVFSKAYGLANIPYQIPNQKETVFNIGSIAKQFTAMGILLLQAKGKLKVDDDIRTYLPELHNFKNLTERSGVISPAERVAKRVTPITIRHLLHHSSGLRSTPELFGLAGWRDGDAIYNDDVFRYLVKQVDLNFEPGSEYIYSNSGYILLAKIIERVAQQDFKTWMSQNIFQKLHMNSTFIEDDYAKIMKQTASSYAQVGSSSFVGIENNDLSYGASNVYTTANDLLTWSKNFCQTSPEWQQAFNDLKTLDTLSTGLKNNYAFGVILDDFYGNARIQHTGGIAGFQSLLYVYPDENLEIIILSNFNSNPINKMANQISQLFLQNKLKPETLETPISPITLSPEELKKHEGLYWNDKTNLSRKIQVINDSLWYIRNTNNKSYLIPLSANEFQMLGSKPSLRVRFESNSNSMHLVSSENKNDSFIKYQDSPISLEQLQTYTGTYYSAELETSYTISLVAGKLIGYHSRFGEFEIQILKTDILSWGGMATTKMQYDSNGNCTGFLLSMNRIRDVWFERR